MALYDQLPVYKASYDLMLQVLDICPKLQRAYRYTLGERILDASSSLLQEIYRANSTYDKLPHLTIARDQVVAMRLFIRLTHDKHQISSKDYLRVSELLENVGRQLTSWHKSISDKTKKSD